MTNGPVEYVVLGFPGDEFIGRVAEALRDLAKSGTIRLLDFVFIQRSNGGDVRTVEFENVEALSALADVDGEVGGVIGLDDIEYVSQGVACGSSVALFIWEDVWAAPLLDALTECDAVLVEGARVPDDLIATAMSEAG
jgi:hypothetical protein